MLNKTRVYRVDKKKQRIYAIILLAIAIPIMIFSINSIIESNIKLATNESGIEFKKYDLNGETFIKNLIYQNNVNEKNRNVLFFIFCIGGLLFILHFYFLTDVKLLIDEEGLFLYSIYKKEPSKMFLWKDMKSIQFGNIYTSGSRIAQYRMKIRYIEMIDNELNNTSQSISVTRFRDYKDLINDIEQVGKEVNIEVFHMND